MPETPSRPLWSGLKKEERLECMMSVIREAGVNSTFRDKLLNEQTRRETIENHANVNLDTIENIRCHPDKKRSEGELVLRLPEIALPADANVDDFFLCTYVDYRKPLPASPPPGDDQA